MSERSTQVLDSVRRAGWDRKMLELLREREREELPSRQEFVACLVRRARLVEANENTVRIEVRVELRHLHLLHPVPIRIVRIVAA